MSMAAEPVLTSAASSESRIPQARPEAKYESGALFEWATAALCLLRGEQIRRALGSGGVSSPSGEVHHVVVEVERVRRRPPPGRLVAAHRLSTFEAASVAWMTSLHPAEPN
jgi:hypothetical protein